MLDLKIINGTVVDGTGAPAISANIGVRDGRIVSIGECNEEARQTIDASGKVVSPGFVDCHTHYDAQVFWDPTLSPSCYHGVTSVYGGFCGFSIAPLTPEAGEYLMPMLARVEGMPVESLAEGVPWNWSSFGEYLKSFEGTLAVNAGFMAGHSAIRRVVMGERAVGEEATPEELEKMCQLLRESIQQGAMGFSSTISPTHNDAAGKPVPSRYATREEFLALAKVVSEFEGTTTEFLPGIEFNEDNIQLMADISRTAQRPLNWNALAVMYAQPADVERLEHQLSATNYARENGAEVIALTVPQTMTIRINFYSGFVFDALPGWAEFFRMPVEERIEKLKDPEYRTELNAKAQSDETGMSRLANWETMTIDETFTDKYKPFEGKTVGEMAEAFGLDPWEALVEMKIADGLKTSLMPFKETSEQEIWALRGRLWKDDRTVIGASDAGAHLDMIDTFAFSTKVLQKGVREFGVIGLEEAVHQLTQKPAELLGIKERGLLKEGWHADIVVFDADTVGVGETYMKFDMPTGAGRVYADAFGIDQVIVNGEVIIANNEYTGATPGKTLRSGEDSYTVEIKQAATG